VDICEATGGDNLLLIVAKTKTRKKEFVWTFCGGLDVALVFFRASRVCFWLIFPLRRSCGLCVLFLVDCFESRPPTLGFVFPPRRLFSIFRVS
jgi:hypothetical protein